jgi:hypothetical protein
MMTAVAIDYTEENYRYAPFHGNMICGGVAQWVTEHVHHYWNWEMERVQGKWKLVFRFQDPDEAVRFKLTWA